MTDPRRKKGAAGLIAAVIFVALVTGLVMANRWLQQQTSEITSPPAEVPRAVSLPPKKPSARKKTGEVIRKTRLSPDRKYETHIFYQDGEEVAHSRSSDGNVYDQTGEIPDGKVKFINESNETYGVEYYKDQRLHGSARTYYKDEALKEETYYQYGKVMTRKEYYHDGIVRMQEDYSDARENRVGHETGIGKVYFRDGTLKYEWHLTVTEPVGFRKSYERSGRLVDAVYYDEYGQVMPARGASAGSDILSETAAPSVADAPRSPRPSSVLPSAPKQILIPAN